MVIFRCMHASGRVRPGQGDGHVIPYPEVILARRKHEKSYFDRARDELFSHIHRCAVLGADAEEQREWFADTMKFMGERYPMLTERELKELEEVGLRFCQPPIPHGSTASPVAQEDANAA